MHLFTRREATSLLTAAGFRVERVRPLSLRTDALLPCPWWCGWLRSYGYLFLARKAGVIRG